jgi:VCBS repeat-containing protein
MADAVLTVAENSAAGTTVGSPLVASDVDAGSAGLLTFGIATQTAEAEKALFAVDCQTGQVSLRAAGVDYEAQHEHIVYVTVTDAGMSPARLSTTARVTIQVTDVNESPILVAPGVTLTVAENSAANTTVGRPLNATDLDVHQSVVFTITSGDLYFDIDSQTGQLTVAEGALLNHESASSIALTVRATETGTGSTGLYASQDLVVDILDVNEPPVFSAGGALVVDENADVGTIIAGVVAPVKDPDANQELVLSDTGGDGQGVFSVVSSPDGLYSLRVAVASLDFETKSSYTLEVTAEDSGVGAVPVTTSMTVTIADVNEPPIFTSGQVRTVAENSPVYTAVGDPLAATDEDSGQVMYFEIVTAPGAQGSAALFGIAAPSSSGQLQTTSSSFNYEAQRSFTVTVRVTDSAAGGAALSDTGTVEVLVTDVEEAPVFPATTNGFHCRCKRAWSYGGVDYSYCAKTPDTPDRAWCYVEAGCVGGYTSTVPSCSTTGQCIWDWCTPVRQVAENSPGGTLIGPPLKAADEPGDVLTYSIKDGAAGSDVFAVSATTGQLTVRSPPGVNGSTPVLATVPTATTWRLLFRQTVPTYNSKTGWASLNANSQALSQPRGPG